MQELDWVGGESSEWVDGRDSTTITGGMPRSLLLSPTSALFTVYMSEMI